MVDEIMVRIECRSLVKGFIKSELQVGQIGYGTSQEHRRVVVDNAGAYINVVEIDFLGIARRKGAGETEIAVFALCLVDALGFDDENA